MKMKNVLRHQKLKEEKKAFVSCKVEMHIFDNEIYNHHTLMQEEDM
jgi:hypothetical protein